MITPTRGDGSEWVMARLYLDLVLIYTAPALKILRL
jgi:hypothetical protein